ncbi:unnamed protein product, partial [Meganyctiphanes norvegica]
MAAAAATTGIMSGVADDQASAVRQRTTTTGPASDRSSKSGSANKGDSSSKLTNGGNSVSEDKSFCERRSDGSSASSGNNSGVGEGGKCAIQLWSRKALLRRKDIPKHLQFNPYIETGYRPLLDAWGCVMSLFYFHNETINILTHG